MHRRIAMLLCAGVLVGNGVADGKPAAPDDTVSGDASAAMAAEWDAYDGVVRCLEALELYTRPGAEDPQLNAELALFKLTSGKRYSVSIYAEAQKLIGLHQMAGLLASASTTIDGVNKDNKIDKNEKDPAKVKGQADKLDKALDEALKTALDVARSAIDSAYRSNREELDRDVNRWYVNDPPRALYGLLKEVEVVAAEYANVHGLIAFAENAKAATETALGAANSAEGTAQTALTAAKNAQTAAGTALGVANSAEGAARTALTAATNAQTAAVTALKSAQNAAKAANKRAKNVKGGENAAAAATAKGKAYDDVTAATTAKDRAYDHVNAATTAKARADDNVSEATSAKKAAADRVSELSAAPAIKAGNELIASTGRKDNDVQKAAICLMESYRICYALGPDRLFKLVHDHFQ
jgi:hypothetical protein